MLSEYTHTAESAKKEMNRLGLKQKPFLFIIDFLMEKPIVIPLDKIDPSLILYRFNNLTNHDESAIAGCDVQFKRDPISFENYLTSFNKVMEHIAFGNSYLVNLTAETPIQTNKSLKEIYLQSKAAFKLLVDNQFTLFSPEPFVLINNNSIRSFPMKGTIDANEPDAEEQIMNNHKELAEHHTIVDLIRNDLNMVSKRVHVERFRYIDRLKTNHGELLQVSSEIAGELSPEWYKSPGDILFSLLPAGSVSGAPKKKTIEIILEAETHQRNYYTGITGIYNGDSLISSVMIRFIEQRTESLYFKSGGGITIHSDAKTEYNEMIRKVYVATD
ncbi:MAG: aminodeoxychorismate synthase component I [Bacteroidales bacterium]|nr:aminodeoxychorismate synthase component I [Bacteroidales bacterium]